MPADTSSLGRTQIGPMTGTLDDHSGTIAAANTSQQLMDEDDARQYFLFQNHSAADMWLIPGTGPATASQPCILVAAGMAYSPACVDRRAWHLICDSSGSAFTCKTA
jgi:hypothetical protein